MKENRKDFKHLETHTIPWTYIFTYVNSLLSILQEVKCRIA